VPCRPVNAFCISHTSQALVERYYISAKVYKDMLDSIYGVQNEVAQAQTVAEAADDVPAAAVVDDEECCHLAKRVIELPPVDQRVDRQTSQHAYDLIVHQGPCCYESEALTHPSCRWLPCGGTIFPTLCPLAVCCPCCALGKTISIVHHEEPTSSCLGRYVGLGPKGIEVATTLCPAIACSPAYCVCSYTTMVLSSAQRAEIVNKYELKPEGGVGKACAFWCYSCALWRHTAFLQAVEGGQRMPEAQQQELQPVRNQPAPAGEQSRFLGAEP